MDKNIRICIVGGGPAGLSAGMYLEKGKAVGHKKAPSFSDGKWGSFSFGF